MTGNCENILIPVCACFTLQSNVAVNVLLKTILSVKDTYGEERRQPQGIAFSCIF